MTNNEKNLNICNQELFFTYIALSFIGPPTTARWWSYVSPQISYWSDLLSGLLTRPWADETKAEARWNEVEAEAEAKARFSGLEAEALTRT